MCSSCKQSLDATEAAAAGTSGQAASAPDDWELDPNDIVFAHKIASGAFGDLYRCGPAFLSGAVPSLHSLYFEKELMI